MASSRSSYHAGLTREAVLGAAVEMLQANGLQGFNLRRLATELGVDPMSLYTHVRNKDDLLSGAVALAIKTARPTGTGEWWTQVADVIREHRRSLKQHPWVLEIALQGRIDGSEAWGGVEATLALMNEHLTPDASARWLHLLVSFTNGYLVGERDQVTPEYADSARKLASSRPLVAEAATRTAQHADEDFELGLAALIEGMRAQSR
jgi:AcrR family transcriptional regulator